MKLKRLFAASVLSLLALAPAISSAQSSSIVSDGTAVAVWGAAGVILIAGAQSTTGTTK